MTSQWTPAYVAIGSNLDNPAAQVDAACSKLARLPQCRLVLQSRRYRSAPLGPQNQPPFVNAVAGMLTKLTANELLSALKQIETAMGRQEPVVRWGPRRIDLDLLVYGAERCADPALMLPHPGVPARNFVLYPLLDIAPDLLVPGHGRVRELAARVGRDGLEPLG